MYASLVFGLTALLATVAHASPAVEKRSYVPGQCGVHFVQQQRANNDDLVTYTVKDNDGNVIGESSGGLADADPESIPSQLPYVINCTQPQASHDINCDYNGETFGSSDTTCGVGDWDNGTRQIDCGFAC